MTLIVGGDRSSSGKTTVTLALLAYLTRQHLSVQSFKVGPDYIDPMFHTYVTGRSCRNLDPVLTSEVYVRECFARHSQTAEFALIEGVMGLFDGIRFADSGAAISNFASTAHIALLLNLPVLLVIDCSKLSGSVAAIARGFTTFDPTIQFAGLVLNRVGSDRHLQLLTEAIAPLNLPILGVLRRQQNITIPDRHLGLIPTDEMPELNTITDDLALMAKSCFNWEKLLPLLKSQLKSEVLKTKDEGSEQQLSMHIPPKDILTPQSDFVKGFSEKKSAFFEKKIEKTTEKKIVAVARDAAFNFYYQDNLDLLEKLGAELIFFSPLKDSSLPPEIHGLYFGGGFPEVFAQQLSENRQMRESVKTAIIKGMPTYAECGGLMYLCQAILDFNNNSWEMVGILPMAAAMGKKLTLGYRQAIALKNSALLKEGDKIFGHEFHRSELIGNRDWELRGNRQDACSTALFKIWRADEETKESWARLEGWQIYRVHASYIHLHWGGRVEIPQRFLEQCQQFSCQKYDDGVI